MPRNNKDRAQINIYSTNKIRHLLRRMAAAELLKNPARAFSMNTLVEKAILDYARRHHRDLVPKEL